ncbi:MAG TPA: hypothetical protein ENG51_08615 [Deltaproteobacteria bacterium]|nr:hypothetical protein [Deltaproteobacteria bacterium]
MGGNSNTNKSFSVSFSELSEIDWLVSEGISVVPLKPKSKEPLIKWKEYQERRPTREEIERWKQQTTNFAAVCGKVSNNLVIIDIDREELFSKLELGPVATKTKVDKTPHGYHIWVRSPLPKNRVLKWQGKPEIEVKANGLAVIAGSENEAGVLYEHFPTSPRKIAEVDPGFFDALEAVWRGYRGLTKKAAKKRGPRLKAGILEVIKSYAGELKEFTDYGDYKQCRCPLPGHEDQHPSFTIYGDDRWYCFGCQRGGDAIQFVSDFFSISRGAAKERLSSDGWLEEDEKKSKEEIIKTSKVETSDGKLYEEIYRDGQALFIDPEGNTYEELEIGGLKYVPISGDELTEGAVLLPSGLEEYQDEKTLIAEIQAHIHKYVDVSPFFERIAGYYILMTWIYDRLNTLPYLRVLGDTGTGKSRFLDTVGRLCYKATIVSGAITPAPIYRLIRRWQGTIVIDEGDFRASDEQAEVVKILNCGFERGRPVVRSQRDNPDTLQVLPTFGPKIIASRKRFKDIALESRCLTEITKETDRAEIPYLLPREFYEEEARLRNMLLAFRFKKRGEIDPEKAQGLKGIDIENRLKQTVSSFVPLVASNEEVYREFVNFLVGYNRELIEERADTFEGGIVNAIWDLMKTNMESITNVTNVTNVTDVKITPTDISEVLIEKYGYTEANPKKIGKVLRTLGITTKREKIGKKTKNVLVLEERELRKLIKKYVPASYEGYESYEGNGTERQKKARLKFHSPVEEGKCERCGRETWLDHEWIDEDGEVRYICPECAAELKGELKGNG